MTSLHRSVPLAGVLLAAALAAQAAPAPNVPPLATVPAQGTGGAATSAFDGVVEAVRQTTLAAQVPGAIVKLAVKAGDRVSAGQVLVQIDARAAEQSAAASQAQVQAAKAALEVATRDFERQKKLFDDRFISQAALDRAQAEHRAAQAQASATIAQAGAALTQSGFYTVRAPYAGVVSEVPVTLGDMALPGRALVTLYDPSALRVAAAVPQSVADRVAAAADAKAANGAAVRVELPMLPAAQRLQPPAGVQVLPAADAGTHTVTVRAELAPGLKGPVPGQFARLWLPAAAEGDAGRAARPWVPLAAVVRRTEMTGLYVLDAQGRALLRQVRLGRSDGQRVEVLTGLAAGERVVADPQAAARMQ
ncbi:MAG TPA: efflux RND transporter periplasmic adaptor subunit [Burkholderiaceae bacterium]|nr:efflux RND transporter periplasmic adaptor subunit [Burkholderiaceae bacterium]